MTAFYPYSVSTGRYTVDQLGGETCARCGRPFEHGQKTEPEGDVDGAHQLYAHLVCPKVVTAR